MSSKIKICVVGDSESTKTEFILAYAEKNFSSSNSYVDNVYGDDTWVIRKSFQGKEQLIKVSIYQSPGLESNLSLRRQAYEDSDVVIMLYNIKVKQSLNDLLDKLYSPNALKLIVGTGSDFRDDNIEDLVTKKEAMDLGVKMESFDYYECSLRTNSGIDEIFDCCYQEFLTKSSSKKKKRSPSILSQKIEEENKQEKSKLNRRRSGSFFPLTSKDQPTTVVNQTFKIENMDGNSKITFELEKLYSIINFLQRENQERKMEIEELKKIIEQKK
eukprot:gene11754-5092_t